MSGIFKPPFGTPLNKSHPLARGLVGSWLMNEGAGLTANDSSGNNYTGDFVSAVSWIPGPTGNVLDFAGNEDYINCGATAALNVTGPFTFSVKVHFENSAINTTFVLGKYTATGDKRQYCLRNASKELTLYLGTSDGTGTSKTTTVGDPIAWTNVWYTITCKWEGIGTASRIFVNGVETSYSEAAVKNDAILDYAGNDFLIGLIEAYPSLYELNGEIDYLHFWDRALTDEEIAYQYAFPFAMFDSVEYPAWMYEEAAAATGNPWYYYAQQ